MICGYTSELYLELSLLKQSEVGPEFLLARMSAGRSLHDSDRCRKNLHKTKENPITRDTMSTIALVFF